MANRTAGTKQINLDMPIDLHTRLIAVAGAEELGKPGVKAIIVRALEVELGKAEKKISAKSSRKHGVP